MMTFTAVLRCIGACVAAIGIAACFVRPAAAADDFYKGKTINLFIGSGPGGGYDLFGRLVARHIGRHIPGEPTVNPQNMPGAGSINSANYIYNAAPQDGTVLGIGTPSIALLDALRQPGVRFESAKFNWIGRVAAEINVTFTAAASGVRTIEDARQKEALIGCISDTSPLTIQTRVMDSVLGTRFKLIKGYADTAATLLAVERGEVEGTTLSWSALQTSKPEWIADKKVNLLVQYTSHRSSFVPDVPSAVEFARTPEESQVISLYVNGGDVGYAIMSGPRVPADRVQILRDAFQAMLTDKAFLDDVSHLGAEFDPLPGAELQKLIVTTTGLTPAARERAQRALTE
jgi:tripartite-type tricarboxylate transporter receptor subunit TctC